MQIIRAEYFPFRDQTEELIKIGLEVHRTLGYGFQEVIYQDAFEYELIQKKIPYIREKVFPVKYKDKVLDRTFKPDFYVYDHLVLELKARSDMLSEDFVQVLNFLKCADADLGLVLNFGREKLGIKRMLFKNTKLDIM